MKEVSASNNEKKLTIQHKNVIQQTGSIRYTLVIVWVNKK